MRRKSNERKLKENYGQGVGVNYKAWIETRDFNSLGTTCNAVDWITGRTVELLSQTEKKVWYLLRWNDNIVDIREQFPLDIRITEEIANKFGISHPKSKGKLAYMTTDFLVTLKNGLEIAINVKANKEEWQNKRVKEKQFIEKYYWQEYKNTRFLRICSEDINEILYKNIEMVTVYYDKSSIHDLISKLKHMIATKQIVVDMENSFLNYQKLMDQWLGGSL